MRWRGCSTLPVRSRPSAQNDRYVELSRQGPSVGSPPTGRRVALGGPSICQSAEGLGLSVELASSWPCVSGSGEVKERAVTLGDLPVEAPLRGARLGRAAVALDASR